MRHKGGGHPGIPKSEGPFQNSTYTPPPKYYALFYTGDHFIPIELKINVTWWAKMCTCDDFLWKLNQSWNYDMGNHELLISIIRGVAVLPQRGRNHIPYQWPHEPSVHQV